MKEQVFRNTQIRKKHEMGEIKRAQEQRIDEVSVQKLRENHETNQQLSSQLQQMQEQMNSMCDSGDFQDVESNYSGRLSNVSSQPEMIPSSRSVLSRDKRLPLDTWNHSGLQENVFGNKFSTFDSPRDHHQGIHFCAPQRERGSVPQASGRGLFSQEMTNKVETQFQCRHLQQSRRLRVLQYLWNYRITIWSDSKDSKYRNCSPNSIQNTSHYLF